MNVVVVGGEWSILQRGLGPKLEAMGLHVVHHHSWDERLPLTTFPKEAEGVIILKSVVGHVVSSETAKAAASKGLKVAIVDHKLSFAIPVLRTQGFLPKDSEIVPMAEQIARSAREYIEEVRLNGRLPGYDEVVDQVSRGLEVDSREVTRAYGRKQFAVDISAQRTPQVLVAPAPEASAQPAITADDVFEGLKMAIEEDPTILLRMPDVSTQLLTYIDPTGKLPVPAGFRGWVDAAYAKLREQWAALPSRGVERTALSQLKTRLATHLAAEAAARPEEYRSAYAIKVYITKVLTSIFGGALDAGLMQRLGADALAAAKAAAPAAAPKGLAEQLMDVAAFVEKAQTMAVHVEGLYEALSALDQRITSLATETAVGELTAEVRKAVAEVQEQQKSFQARLEGISRSLGTVEAAQKADARLLQQVEELQGQLKRQVLEEVRAALREDIRVTVRGMLGAVTFTLRPESRRRRYEARHDPGRQVRAQVSLNELVSPR